MAVSALCSDARHEEVDEGHVITTPLPWGQLLIVLLIQFAEPITAFVIFPFINQMIRETDVTVRQYNSSVVAVSDYIRYIPVRQYNSYR